ncbi:MAG: dicarboxylate/amino acid:cation symporter [Alphaproteobacteria bacterium]
MKLWQKVTLGLIAGVIFGIIAKENTKYVKPIGDIFINLIKMVVTPLVFFSLVSGITSMTDPSSLGRIGIKASGAFILTTTFAIIIGLGIALIMKPGVGVALNLISDQEIIVKEFNLGKFITNIVPTSAIGALAHGEMLQVVFFAIFTGITLNALEEEGRVIVGYFQLMAKLVFKMIAIIMNLSPYGAFALTSWLVGTQGIEVLQSLFKLVMAVIVAMLFQYLVFGLLIWIFTRLSPIPFYRKSFEYQALAFSTSSSKATLATTMKICRNKLGISNTSTSFVLPLGASINMDGMAIYLGMCAIFFAQATNTVLHSYDYFMIVLTATLGSIGAAGIPGGSMVMLPMVLSSVHIPIEGVALIAGIDRILDMLRTTVNITGDATITLIVDKSEGTHDEKTYYS